MIVSKGNLFNIINEILIPNSTIGIHELSKNNDRSSVKDNMERAFEMLNSGIIIDSADCYSKFYRKKIYKVINIIGTLKFRNKTIESEINGYVPRLGNMNYLIICIPQEIISESGKSLFIGTLNGEAARSIDTYSDLDTDKYDYDYNDNTCKADVLFSNLIPPEFIVGNVRYLNSDKVNLTLNTKYLGFNDGIVSDKLYTSLEEIYNRWYDKNVNTSLGLKNYVLYNTQRQEETYEEQKAKGNCIPKTIPKTSKIWEIYCNPDSVEQAIEDTTFHFRDWFKLLTFGDEDEDEASESLKKGRQKRRGLFKW